MSYTIAKRKVITYPSEHLRTFETTLYEWIDNLSFTLSLKECLENANDYLKIATELFLGAGWMGDGRIRLMWIPPFVTHNTAFPPYSFGITLWHVKQWEDSISYLLHPKGLFEYMREWPQE